MMKKIRAQNFQVIFWLKRKGLNCLGEQFPPGKKDYVPLGNKFANEHSRKLFKFLKKFKNHDYISHLNMDISITTITSPNNCFDTCLGFSVISTIVA
jgi:hypothetical protein